MHTQTSAGDCSAVLYTEISKGSTAQLCRLGLYKFLIDLVNLDCEQYSISKNIKATSP